MTGAQVVNPDAGLLLREVGLDVLGSARRVVVSKDDTVIVDGGGTADAVADRVKQLRAEIENSDSDWDREKLQERLAKLAGGVAVIKVGAATETALKERKESVEDAVAAAKAAVEEGIVAGGGSALIQARKALKELRASLTGDEALGVDVFSEALSAPLYWIATNAGLDGAVVVNKVERAARRARAQRGHADLRRLGRRRRHRPGQGHPLGGAQRRVGGPDGAHHRDGDRREAGRGGRPRPRPPRPRSLGSAEETPPVHRRGCFVIGMDRIWQWAWDRYKSRYSWACWALTLPLALPGLSRLVVRHCRFREV